MFLFGMAFLSFAGVIANFSAVVAAGVMAMGREYAMATRTPHSVARAGEHYISTQPPRASGSGAMEHGQHPLRQVSGITAATIITPGTRAGNSIARDRATGSGDTGAAIRAGASGITDMGRDRYY